MKLFKLFVLFSFFCTIQGCSAGDPQPLLRSASINVGKVPLMLELAITPSEHSKGLMFRRSMEDSQGMLFIYKGLVTPEPFSGAGGFWMKNTYLPLSIAFFSPTGTIQEIFDMQPLSEKTVLPNYPYSFALELNQGAFGRLGIRVGDRIDLASIDKAMR